MNHENVWTVAVPDSHDRARAVLSLLIRGATQARAARELHVSRRCVEIYVSRIREQLGARTQYMLGVLAIRTGLVVPDIDEGHTPAPSGGAGPTPRQRPMLLLLAGGRGYADVAMVIGLSERTVRREVGRLAVAHGVAGLLAAGARFEARGWHRSPRSLPRGREGDHEPGTGVG